MIIFIYAVTKSLLKVLENRSDSDDIWYLSFMSILGGYHDVQ